MKVVDIHPEELIDRLQNGELSGVERERLDAHLAQCSSCRFEIGVRADLEQEAPLLAQRPQLTHAGQVAPRTLPLTADAPQSAPRAPASVRPRIRRRWRLVMLAAALVLCAGGATAAVVAGAVVAPNWLPWASELKAANRAASASDAKAAHQSKRAAKPVVTSVAAPVPSLTATAVEAVAPVALPPEPASAPNVAARAMSPPSLAPVREAVHAPPSAVNEPEPSSAAFPNVPEGESAAADALRPAGCGSITSGSRGELVRGCQSRAPRRQRGSRRCALPVTAKSLPERFGEPPVARSACSIALGAREPEPGVGRLRSLPRWGCSGAER